MLRENKARILCKQVLQRCGSHPAEVILTGNSSALTRFANNAIHQNVAERNLELLVRLFIGKRSGIASTNRSDPDSLDELVQHAIALAQASPEDPDFLGLSEPQASPPVEAFDQATAGYSPEQRAEQVGLVCRLAAERGLNAYGAFLTSAEELAIANSLGLFVSHVSTKADFQTVVMAPDASGRAHASSWKAADLDIAALGAEAIQKAEQGRSPQAIEPGEYAVVFDPYVTEDLLTNLNYYGMGAQAVLDGRSWMNDLIGEQAMDARVNIWDDGCDSGGLPLPFDYEGLA
ncbi:MAG TPA: metallopeptidase TldD-related protein, partial [Anaerolineales bacterium]|nr:metallopeptidase TldD-related protein [Anaerolineales bacterium]